MVQIITNSNGGGGGVGVYKYKGSVQTYEDLPTSGMKIGDTYNVINEHTTNPKFPAGTNVAWTGTEWDALGGNIDLSGYQKKLVEGDGIDINQTTNEISVEDAVIGGAAKGATAIQPNDNVSELVNDAGYLVSSDLKQSNWGQTDSSAIDYIKNKPTIGNATLTIQKNGTTVNTITMNATSNVTANIGVPTKVSDLSNDSGFITKDVNDLTNYTKTSSLGAVALSNNYSDLSNKPDLSVYQTTANLVTDLNSADNTHYPSAKAVADAITASGGGDMLKSVYDPNNKSANAFDYNNFINTPTIPGVIDNLNSSSTTDALSANQGKVLKDAIDNLSGLGKFLSLWNSATGQPISFPLATPYTYTTGDWFMVEVVGTTNYKPNGSSYTGTASTTVESGTVAQGDVYIYDGTNWLLQKNADISVSFSALAGQPTDNTALAAALNAKQDTLTAGVNIDITSNKVSANNCFIVTEDIVTVSTDATKGVAPYSTSYGYTNIDISASAGIEWREGAIYTFDVNTEMVVASAYRNVRVKIGNGAYIPVMGTSSILTGSSYFTKANIRQYQYSTKYQSGGALHLFTDSNTTYSNMSASEATTGTATSARTISASVLKGAIQTHAPVQSVNGQTGAVTLTIPTVNNATLTIQKNGTNVQTFTANQSTNATANITVPTDTGDLTNGAGFITGITSGDVTSALGYTPYNSTNPSGYLTSSTGVTSVNGSHGAITVNEPKVSATAPLSPTEGMVWYDTTNDVLKTYDGSNWNEVGGGSNDVNTKTFYLSSTRDLTNAQAAYDWYVAGKNPIVVYGTEKPIYTVYDTSGGLRFRSSDSKKSTSGSSSMINYWKMLSLVVSNGNVTSISVGDYTGNAISVLATGQNYSTPYTPQYDGSPATKKYVDDNAGIQNDTTGTTSTIDAEWVGTDAEFKALSSYGNKIYNIIE